MDTKTIAELANIVKQTGLTKLEIQEADTRIVLEAAPAVAVAPPVAVAPITESESAKDTSEEVSAPSAGMHLDDIYEQKTPLVGTVYLAPQVDAAPFVQVGDHIAAGDTVCIVESMKMFNEIAAECSGTIEEICVSNSQIVEYGQVLVRIRED